MDEVVPHPCDDAPRDVCTCVLEIGRQVLDGLADDLNPPEDRILNKRLSQEVVFTHPCDILPNALATFDNVAQQRFRVGAHRMPT